MKNRILTLLIIICSAFNLYSQRNITPEEYQKIITTDAYYWGKSDWDLPLDVAKKQAREELISQISEVKKVINEPDLMKKANCVKFEVEGNRARIIFYIPKDSLSIEHVVEKPKEVEPEKEPKTNLPTEKKLVVTEVATESIKSEPVKVESGNEIINTLSKISNFDNFRIQLNKYKRQDLLFDSQSGTPPDALENCIMAIFENGVLKALYDRGSAFRNDFLTGKIVEKPEELYKNKPNIKVIFIKLNQKK